MIIKHDIKSYSITWLASSYDKTSSKGIISNYYIPENLEELVTLCRNLYSEKKDFYIIGHTSNVYIQPNTNITNVISIRKLTKWKLNEDFLYCECGVNVKLLSSAMIEAGKAGFEGLVDLPGTIGGAVYGNASVSRYSIAGLLKTCTILLETGEIRQFKPNELEFSFRSSNLKSKKIRGVILSCELNTKSGNIEQLRETARYVHEWREKNQCGPKNNLGTTALISRYTLKGVFLCGCVRLMNISHSDEFRKNWILRFFNATKLKPYLSGLNRYIWRDKEAHNLFPFYLETLKKIYKDPKLEIEVW